MTTKNPTPDPNPDTQTPARSWRRIGRTAAYRLRQGRWALAAGPRAADLEIAKDICSPSLLRLFQRLSPPEQRHALRVVNRLQQDAAAQPELLVAALLHDVGRTLCPLRLWERAFVVLGQALAPAWACRAGEGTPRGWRRAFVVARQHPAWGASLAAEAGADPGVCALIRDHQDGVDSSNPWLAALRKADRES